MFYKENVGVILPKQTTPWILDGKDQPKSVKRLFVTPYGTFPRMGDITALYGRSKREVEDRRMKRDGPKFTSWYIKQKPTIEEVEAAIKFVNEKYVEVNSDSDNCTFCDALDEALNKENCWLVTTTHDCSNLGQQPAEIEILYSYGGNDYTVNLLDWMEGVTPHRSTS